MVLQRNNNYTFSQIKVIYGSMCGVTVQCSLIYVV